MPSLSNPASSAGPDELEELGVRVVLGNAEVTLESLHGDQCSGLHWSVSRDGVKLKEESIKRGGRYELQLEPGIYDLALHLTLLSGASAAFRGWFSIPQGVLKLDVVPI